MSQNVTQNFYEANTQVFHDITNLECTQGEEIHEALTQKVNLVEFKIPENPRGPESTTTSMAACTILNKNSNGDIVEPSTSENRKTERDSESTKELALNIQNNLEVFCAATQAVNLGTEGNSVYSCPTQDLGSFMEPVPAVEDNENYIEVMQVKDTELDIHDVVTQVIDLPALLEKVDASVKAVSHVSVETLKENGDKMKSVSRNNVKINADDSSNDSVDFLNLEKSITTPTLLTEDQPQPREKGSAKQTSNSSDDETDIEDFLISKPQDAPTSETDAESQIGFKKKAPRTLIESDSETEDEDVIERKRRKVVRIPPTQESEDSDILPTKRKPIPLPSTQEESYVIETDSDAETSTKHLETSIPATQNMTLNDSCCVLATQVTKPTDQINTHADSEENFKLGLTQLFFDNSQGVGGDKTEEIAQEGRSKTFLSDIAAPKLAEDRKEATNENEDGIYTAQTQAISSYSEISKTRHAYHLDQANKTSHNIENNITVVQNIEETAEGDSFLAPTQKISNLESNNTANSDLYSAQTQKVDEISEAIRNTVAEKVSCRQHIQAAEEDAPEIDENDLYLAQTQKICISKMSNLDDTADSNLYLAPTQKLNMTEITSLVRETAETIDEDNIYFAQTQLNDADMQQRHDTVPQQHKPDQDESVYFAPTQKYPSFAENALPKKQFTFKNFPRPLDTSLSSILKCEAKSNSLEVELSSEQVFSAEPSDRPTNPLSYFLQGSATDDLQNELTLKKHDVLCKEIRGNQEFLNENQAKDANGPNNEELGVTTTSIRAAEKDLLSTKKNSKQIEKLEMMCKGQNMKHTKLALKNIKTAKDDDFKADNLNDKHINKEAQGSALEITTRTRTRTKNSKSCDSGEVKPIGNKILEENADNKQITAKHEHFKPDNPNEDHINKEVQGAALKITARAGTRTKTSKSCDSGEVEPIDKVILEENDDNKKVTVEKGEFKEFSIDKAGRLSTIKENMVFHSINKEINKETARSEERGRPKRKLSTDCATSKVNEISDIRVNEAIKRKALPRRRKISTDSNKNDIEFGSADNSSAHSTLKGECSSVRTTSRGSEVSDHEIPMDIVKPPSSMSDSTSRKKTIEIEDTSDSDSRNLRKKKESKKIKEVAVASSLRDCQGDSDMSKLEVSCESEVSRVQDAADGRNRHYATGTKKTAPVSETPRGRKDFRKRNTTEEVGSNNTSDTSDRSIELHMSTPKKQRLQPKDEIVNTVERNLRKQKPKVVFTMMDSPQMEAMIRQLGGSVVQSVNSCTVLVTEQVKRSQKLLVAIGLSKPICSPKWITDSKRKGSFLDPWDYILRDQEAEKKWNFSLEESLNRSMRMKLLEDYTFQLMVTTAADVLKGAIESCGGRSVSKLSGRSGPNTFVICSPENQNRYQKMLKQHTDLKAIEPEAIFDGVLRQELRFSRHYLPFPKSKI
ncbi:uncharacterized protein LOC132699503 isoform X2 [Cylas formicarius]|nr:uncharacterized protein LOC132699503 isoform X2 [Cylas formicarius]